jgi:hypothetical protein
MFLMLKRMKNENMKPGKLSAHIIWLLYIVNAIVYRIMFSERNGKLYKLKVIVRSQALRDLIPSDAE